MFHKCNKILRYNKKYLFWMAYLMYLAELILFSSMFGEISYLELVFALIRNVCYGLICLKIIVDFCYGEFGKKEILLNLIGTLYLIVLAKMTSNKSMLIYWVFIVAAHDIELKKIVKAAISVHLFCMIVIIGSSVFGFIEDRIYMEGTDRVRASLGYQYTTDVSNYLLHIILMYIYLYEEKISWKFVGVFVICNLLIFRITDTKSAFILSNFALFGAVIIKFCNVFIKNNRIYKLGTILSLPILACIVIYLSVFYNNQISWMVKINNMFNNRLELGNNAYNTYGFHLLAQKIQWIGGSAFLEKTAEIYNYVDSTYMQILLNYGMIFFLTICTIFIILAIKVVKNNDIYLMLVLIVLALHSMIDPQLLWMAYNPFIMCYYYINNSNS